MKKRLIPIVVILTMIFGLMGTITAHAATETEIDDAIQDGLAWMTTQQYSDGHFGGSYPLAQTAAAVLAFENEGHFPGGGTAYSLVVEKGLDYLFRYARINGISVQTYGYPGRSDNPDSNGNGLGVYFEQVRGSYETGMVIQAIVASNSPDRVVPIGPCSGMTYEEVLEDTIDWLAWAQCDGGSGRGGWRYYPFNNRPDWSDNSVSQWPVLGMVAAEQWGIYAPQFVKDELDIWIDYIQQDSSGGSGYSNPNEWVNIAKTGGLLVEMYYVGDDKDTPRAQAAINYINSRWNVSPYGTWFGNKGHSYAMFSVFKGLELMEVDVIPAAPVNDETPAGDWWGDYCEYLVNTQYSSGYWSGYSSFNHWLSTAWYIVILQATVFPVQLEVELPAAACDVDGYDVDIEYSIERFSASGTLEIYEDGSLVETVAIVDFQGNTTYTYTVDSDTPGSHTWTAVLDVSATGDATAHIEDQASLYVCESPKVAGIADQTAPFTSFDLDDYLTYGGGLAVTWSSNVPSGWTVAIDGDNVATVTAPEGANDPEAITYTASVTCPDYGLTCSGSDEAIYTPNQPPDVSEAYPSTMCIWPPNHKLVDINILGVTDPDGDDVTITITGITSDEPTAYKGSGGRNHVPDAYGIGSDTAQVRAERSGKGDGRVYVISFTADDGNGGVSYGSVAVSVPHDKSGKTCPAIDSGQYYDATGTI
ncbi:hypothetical protein ACFLVP_00350 [Chloroflexota bacterium]